VSGSGGDGTWHHHVVKRPAQLLQHRTQRVLSTRLTVTLWLQPAVAQSQVCLPELIACTYNATAQRCYVLLCITSKFSESFCCTVCSIRSWTVSSGASAVLFVASCCNLSATLHVSSSAPALFPTPSLPGPPQATGQRGMCLCAKEV